MILRQLEGYAMAGDSLSEADRLHLIAEATKSAYRVRDEFIADPAHVPVDVDGFLSDEWAARARSQIRLDGVQPGNDWHGGTLHQDTVYLCAVDRDGNACSFINSLFSSFGSGIVAPESGVILQNRGSSFRTIPGHASTRSPRASGRFTRSSPAMLVKDGRAVMPFGVMGGHYQAVGHAHSRASHARPRLRSANRRPSERRASSPFVASCRPKRPIPSRSSPILPAAVTRSTYATCRSAVVRRSGWTTSAAC